MRKVIIFPRNGGPYLARTIGETVEVTLIPRDDGTLWIRYSDQLVSDEYDPNETAEVRIINSDESTYADYYLYPPIK